MQLTLCALNSLIINTYDSGNLNESRVTWLVLTSMLSFINIIPFSLLSVCFLAAAIYLAANVILPDYQNKVYLSNAQQYVMRQ